MIVFALVLLLDDSSKKIKVKILVGKTTYFLTRTLHSQVTQVYIEWVEPGVVMPQLQLVGVHREELPVNTPTQLTFTIEPHQMQVWDDTKGFIYHMGGCSKTNRNNCYVLA